MLIIFYCLCAGPQELSVPTKEWVVAKREELTLLMWSAAGIVRRRADMKEALQQLAGMHVDVQARVCCLLFAPCVRQQHRGKVMALLLQFADVGFLAHIAGVLLETCQFCCLGYMFQPHLAAFILPFRTWQSLSVLLKLVTILVVSSLRC